MVINNTIKKISSWKAWRLAAFFVPFVIVLFWLDIFTWQIPLALLLSFAAYIIFHDKLWELMILSAPMIVFGTIIHLQIRPNWIYEMTITELILTLVFVVFLFERFFSIKMDEIRLDWFVVLMLGYLAWALSTFSHSGNFHNFISQARLLVFSLMAYFLVINLFDEMYKIKNLFISMAVTVVLLSAELFWKFYDLGFSMRFFTDRSSIILPVGALALAASMLAMFLPLMLALGLSEKLKTRRALYLLAFALGFLAIFMTLGKAALGSLALGLLVVFYKFRSKRLAIVLALNLFLVTAFVFLAPYLSGLLTRLSTVTSDSNVSFRVEEYVIAKKILNDNWLYGVGLGQEPVKYARQYPFEYNELVNNYWLQIILDLGVVGLSMALLAFGSLYRRLRKLIIISTGVRSIETWYAYGLLGCAVTVFVNGLAEVTVFALNYALLLWLLVGTGVAFVNLRLEAQKN